MTKWFRIIAIGCIVLSLGLMGIEGCTGMHNQDGTPLSPEQYFQRYEHVIKLGVQVGIINLLETNPTYAGRVKAFTGYMETYLASNNVLDLSQLEKIARDKIDWSKYDATERLLVEALLTTVRVELGNVLTANNLPAPPERVAFYAGKFLAWVHEGALVFEAQQSQRGVVPMLPPAN
jgi:hypothetical protein